jgi:hypothetical protein
LNFLSRRDAAPAWSLLRALKFLADTCLDRAEGIPAVVRGFKEFDMTNAPQFDITLSINEIVAAHPETIAVFNRYGFDTCCGGGIRVHEAAQRDGVNVTDVIAALNEALAAT